MPLSSDSNLPHFAIHECEWLPKEGTEVVCQDPKHVGQWRLHIFKGAIEADLEEEKADYIGELLDFREYAIRHCPFCGVHLRNELPVTGTPLLTGARTSISSRRHADRANSVSPGRSED